MQDFKINICSIGDPLNPKTWSGTPYNIAQVLKEKELLGKTIQSDYQFTNRILNHLRFRANRLYYQNSKDVQRGIFERYIKSYKLQKSLLNNSHTLHMGTLDMPFKSMPKNQHHYLFCDSTWHLWSNRSTSMTGYKAKLLADAERLEKKAYEQFTHIFAISEYVKEDLLTHYNIPPPKISVVGTGLGIIQPFNGEKDYSNNKILFAAKGRFKDKGGFLVLEAFKTAFNKNPALQLTIVGKNDYEKEISHPGISKLGFVPFNNLQELFNTHSLFLMTAINEPWGLVYLEALACKMPIMGLNRNAFPELSGYGKYGYILKEETPEELANQILAVMKRPEELKQKGEMGQQFCLDNFGWNKTVSKIIDTIQNQYLA